MKKNITIPAVFILLFCVFTIALCGCETVKGMGRDVKNADKWVRDNLW